MIDSCIAEHFTIPKSKGIFVSSSQYESQPGNYLIGASIVNITNSSGRVELNAASNALRISPWDLESSCFQNWFPITQTFEPIGSDTVAVYGLDCEPTYVTTEDE